MIAGFIAKLAASLPTSNSSNFGRKSVLLATVVDDLFSIATTPSVGKGTTPFPGFLYFNLDTYLILLSVKQGGIKYHL